MLHRSADAIDCDKTVADHEHPNAHPQDARNNPNGSKLMSESPTV